MTHPRWRTYAGIGHEGRCLETPTAIATIDLCGRTDHQMEATVILATGRTRRKDFPLDAWAEAQRWAEARCKP